jgi:MFS family permease
LIPISNLFPFTTLRKIIKYINENIKTNDDNMNKFYSAAALFNNWLIIPINSIFFLKMDISYSQIAWMEVLNCIIVFGLDIPSGSFADKYGRKKIVMG